MPGQDKDDGEQNEPADADASTSKKRRRDRKSKDVKSKDGTKSEASNKTEHRKQIVRIRAKVHCTAAGQPGLDAPSTTEGQAQEKDGEDGTSLPKWHPLKKVPLVAKFVGPSVPMLAPYCCGVVVTAFSACEVALFVRRSTVRCREKYLFVSVSIPPINGDRIASSRSRWHGY